MLITDSRFAEARALAEQAVADERLDLGDEWMARWAEVTADTERTTAVLAAWAQVASVIAPPERQFTKAPEAEADSSWVREGQVLVSAALKGTAADLEDTASLCARRLDQEGRAWLIGQWATTWIPAALHLAGSVDDLAGMVERHRAVAGEEQGGWVEAAAWVVCAFAAQGGDRLANARMQELADAGHAGDLWRTWVQVAPSLLTLPLDPPYEHPEPGFPTGLVNRAVEAAVHGHARQLQQLEVEFARHDDATTSILLMELAAMISARWNVPRERAARRAARGEGPAQGLPGEEVLDLMPPQMVERMGRMGGLTNRAVLAYIDGDPDTLAAIVDRIGTWDDEPGRQPYPLPRYQHAAKTAMQLANTFFDVAAINGQHIANWAVADGAAQLIEQHAPAQHRQEAVARLAVLRRAGDAASFSDSDLDGEAGFLAFTAAAAFLGMDRRVAASRETVRLKLIEHIRQDEAAALRVPARERITSISDEEALTFLDDLYGEGYPLPRDPQERAVWEQDILAVIKQHLLEIPAASTTPEHRRALHDRVIAILQAAAGTPHRTPKPRPRDGIVRNQPKRATKRRRK